MEKLYTLGSFNFHNIESSCQDGHYKVFEESCKELFFRKNIANHTYRGYIIISKQQVLETSVNDGKFAPWNIPPVNTVFGELTDWHSLLSCLTEISTVSESLKRYFSQSFRTNMLLMQLNYRIQKCLPSLKIESTVLSNKQENRKKYDILGSIITLTCLADLIKELDFKPKKTAGYSYGELACAYFDGVLKLEEVLQCAYVLNTELVKVGSNTLTTYSHYKYN